MKTTIEVHGYQIIIEESEGSVSVSALKDEETVEEFTLEAQEEGSEEDSEGGDELRAFGDEEAQENDFEDSEESEDDFEESEEPEESEDDFEEGGEEDLENVEEEGKLESFNSFIKKRR